MPPPDVWDWTYSYDTARMLSILLEYVVEVPVEIWNRLDLDYLQRDVQLVPGACLGRHSRGVWVKAAALSLACMRACGHVGGMGTKRTLATGGGITADPNRAARFRRKCLRDYAAVVGI